MRDGAAAAAPPAGWPGARRPKGLFSLGRRGPAVNAFAVVYGALMAINIGWPRTEIYGAGNYLWGGLIFVAGAIVGGLWFAAVGQPLGWQC